MTELEQYVYNQGFLAHEDMLRDRKFQHLGVTPLWGDVEEAWVWFSDKFLVRGRSQLDSFYDVFMKGWNDYETGSKLG